jgi:pimeloyl-ACP methyl ester carboxylesterase
MAEDVAFLCDLEGFVGAVTISHSVGGLVALELARRRADLVRLLVLVESPILPPADHAERSAALLDGLRGPDYRAFVEQWARRMVSPGAPYASSLIDAMRSTPQAVAVTVVERTLAYDSAAAVVDCSVPLVVVGGQVDLTRLHTLRPDAIALPAVGTSHYGHLDAPDELESVIDSAIARLSDRWLPDGSVGGQQVLPRAGGERGADEELS